MGKYIYYTGVGSKKDGKYTEKEFLELMGKQYKEACLNEGLSYLEQQKLPSCKKKNEGYENMLNDINKNIKRSKKYLKERDKKLDKLTRKCRQEIRKKRKNRECDLKEYIDYVGAEEMGNDNDKKSSFLNFSKFFKLFY